MENISISNTTAASLTIEQAIDEFYRKHNFGQDGGAKDKYAWIKFGFFSVPIPNTDSRKRNIFLHDVNHLIADYDTTWKGESAVGAWEVASGGWGNLFFLWFLTLWAMGLGVLIYPKHVLTAFRKGQTMLNAYSSRMPKSEISKLKIAQLRKKLSNQPKRTANPYFWMLLSLLIFISPFVLFLSGLLFLINWL